MGLSYIRQRRKGNIISKPASFAAFAVHSPPVLRSRISFNSASPVPFGGADVDVLAIDMMEQNMRYRSICWAAGKLSIANPRSNAALIEAQMDWMTRLLAFLSSSDSAK